MVSVLDPWVKKSEVSEEYGITLISDNELGRYDGIVIAVAHDKFRSLSLERLQRLRNKSTVVYDLKNVLADECVDLRL
jgi:UDP-N-acetyl-D-galactosamine dehydrogenase